MCSGTAIPTHCQLRAQVLQVKSDRDARLTFIRQIISPGKLDHVLGTRCFCLACGAARQNLDLGTRNVELRCADRIPDVQMLDAKEVLTWRRCSWEGEVYARLAVRQPIRVVFGAQTRYLEPVPVTLVGGDIRCSRT